MSDAMLMTVDEYAGFVGVRPRTVRGWIKAGFIEASDFEADGRLWRELVSLSLIFRLATPMAARIAFLELSIIDANVARAVATFERWAARGIPRTWREMAAGYNHAQAVSGTASEAAGLRRVFAMTHLEPEAVHRRALLRTPSSSAAMLTADHEALAKKLVAEVFARVLRGNP
jgi:hypothetical protein